MSIKLYSPTNLEKRFAPYVNWAHLYEIPATNVGPQPLYRLQHFKHRCTELLNNTKADIIIFVNVCYQRGKKVDILNTSGCISMTTVKMCVDSSMSYVSLQSGPRPVQTESWLASCFRHLSCMKVEPPRMESSGPTVVKACLRPTCTSLLSVATCIMYLLHPGPSGRNHVLYVHMHQLIF